MGKPFIDDGGMIWTLIGLGMMLWLIGGGLIHDYKYISERNRKYFIGMFATKTSFENGLYGFCLVPNFENETLGELRNEMGNMNLIGVIRGINEYAFIDRVFSSSSRCYVEDSDCYVMEEEKFINIVKIYAREYSVTILKSVQHVK